MSSESDWPEDFPDSSVPSSEQALVYAPDLIAIYKGFKSMVADSHVVLYPSCSFDASPSRVFGDVTFVDIDPAPMKKMREAGLKAINADINHYVPESPHDLVILLNPAIPSEWATRHLVPGGYIIANDWHSNATEMAQAPDQYTLWGTIDFVEKDRRKEDNRVVISHDLTDLFVPVKDAEEFKQYRPVDFGHTEHMIGFFSAEGTLRVAPEASFEEKWAAFRQQMGADFPARRVAQRYIFVKK